MLQQQVKKANAICLKINDLEDVLLHCLKRTLALLAFLVFPRFHQKSVKMQCHQQQSMLEVGNGKITIVKHKHFVLKF